MNLQVMAGVRVFSALLPTFRQILRIAAET